MKRSLVLSGILLAGLSFPAAAGPLKEVGIFYYDQDFKISYELSQGLETAARSTDTFKIEAAATIVSHTDGRRFILSLPQGLTLDELSATTNYSRTGETGVLLGGKSVLSSAPDLSPALRDLIIRFMRPYFTVKEARADLVTGVTPLGKTFRALDLKTKAFDGRWSRTINIAYVISAGGEKTTVTEACAPMGMSGFSREVLEKASRKDNNILISVGLGSRLLATAIGMPADNAIERLEKLKTDIVALDPEDLRYLREWSEKRTVPVSTGAISFLCSNIEIKDAKLAELVKPYIIKELNGVRTAFISFLPSNAGQLADLSDLPVTVKNPVDLDSRSSLVEELRGAQNAKLVVAVLNSREDLGRVLQTPGIDIIIGPKNWEKTGTRRGKIELEDWGREIHSAPAAFIIRDSRGIGALDLEFSGDGVLKTLQPRSVPFSAEDTLYDSEDDRFKELIFQHFFGSKEFLLPDIRKIYTDLERPKLQYSHLDFRNILVSVLKEKTGAEIAFMKIQPFSSNILGDVSASMIKTWLGEDDKVVKAWVPGSLIRALTHKFEFKLEEKDADGYRKYHAGEYFAVSGLNKEQLISGLPVKDGELYLAAFPAGLLRETGKYPQLKDARIAGYEQKTLNTIIIEYLTKIKTEAADGSWEAAIRKHLENKPARRPVWRLNLRDLSLQLSDTGVRHTENFSQVSDSRLRTTGQRYIQGSGKLFSEFYSGNLRFDSGLSANYGKITLRPKGQPRVKTESVDQILIESELKYQLLRYQGFLGPMVLGPFFNLAYDTEFTHQPDLPVRKIVRGRAGLKLFEGAYVRELYTGLVTEQTYTYSPARTRYAAEAGFGMNMLLPGTALLLIADGNYRIFAGSRFDTAADLKQRLELNFKVSTRLYRDVMITPFFNFFLATNKLAAGTATNIMTGFSLSYSHLFKLKH